MSKKKGQTFTGTIRTTRSGFGFVQTPEHDESIKIEPGFLNTALHQDTVRVQLRPTKKEEEAKGEVVEVIERAKKRFVGVVERQDDLCFVNPDDRKMYVDILITKPKDIADNQKVLVELVRWDDPAKEPIGKIIDVLGEKGDHETEILSIVHEQGIDIDFPSPVLKEAKRIENDWKKKKAQFVKEEGRRDFRDITTFTIDPDTAKDFDDALSIQLHKNGSMEVGIHIADVSHFVTKGGAIDEEAQERAFSTYLVDRTIPMLPEVLSNGICSLNPETDRLTFSAIFTLDKNSAVTDRWFGKGVISSDKRFTYKEAQKQIDAGNGSHHTHLQALNTHAERLRTRRLKEGAIDFDQDEVEVTMDDSGKPIDISRKERLATHKLVEEYMLLANREVAQYVHALHKKHKVQGGFIYRVHDKPDHEKIEHIDHIVRALGHTLPRTGKDGRLTSKDINTLLRQIDGKQIDSFVKKAMIRAMAKAEYAAKNIGHFGLGFKYYTHFTSPIRRYADLSVHRSLESHLKKGAMPKKDHPSYGPLTKALSEKEIDIQQAERDSITYKQVEYMSERVGNVFDGIISGVTEWGVYVEEKDTGAEGLVHVRDIDSDYFVYDEKRYRLVGQKTKKTYALGDKVKVKLVGANVDRKTLDFVFT